MATPISAIDTDLIEKMLWSIKQAQIQQKEESSRIPIKTIQEARSRVNRLSNLSPDTNFDLIWKDRTTAIIGISPENLRIKLGEYRAAHHTGKSTASWYECIDIDPIYRDAAISTVYEMERQYGISGVVYREGKMTLEQSGEFDMVKIPALNDDDFKAWYLRRCKEFESIGAKFCSALECTDDYYKPRLYGQKYVRCGLEFIGDDKEKVYNCLETTPHADISRQIIREYMVIVARACLVI